MKPLLAGLALTLLVGCTASRTAMQQQAITTLTDDAKAACTQQAVFNMIASEAAGFGPQAAAAASIASALVGVGCSWVNR